MILLVWILNYVISWLNAWGCGKTWTESKYAGGWPHFLNWCGAIMAASGFTWCYLVLFGFFGGSFPIEQDDGTTAPLLDAESLQAFADLGYMLVVFPIIGSGIAITVHSWGVFWRERNFKNGAVAGWNSFAQVYNMVSAFEHVPRATSGLGDFFKGDSDKKGAVVILVVLAALAGIVHTYLIITKVARATAKDRWLQCKMNPEYAER